MENHGNSMGKSTINGHDPMIYFLPFAEMMGESWDNHHPRRDLAEISPSGGRKFQISEILQFATIYIYIHIYVYIYIIVHIYIYIYI